MTLAPSIIDRSEENLPAIRGRDEETKPEPRKWREDSFSGIRSIFGLLVFRLRDGPGFVRGAGLGNIQAPGGSRDPDQGLKENDGMDGFCCEDFAATEAAFRWVCVAYNLMALYKIALINTKHDPTLSTLKFQCIAIASYLVRQAGRPIWSCRQMTAEEHFLSNFSKNWTRLPAKENSSPKTGNF